MKKSFAVLLLLPALHLQAGDQKPPSPIEFTVVPPSGSGNALRVDRIEGRVQNPAPGERIVLYAKSDGWWWVQPRARQPFTDIQKDTRWNGMTHPGATYAALLVDAQYQPLPKIDQLPKPGGSVHAVATVAGGPATPSKEIQFSGYPWRLRDGGRQQTGQVNFYDPSNAWTDQNGFLHLRVTRSGDRWLCSEVTLSRNLGYGSYRFVVRDLSQLEPSAVLIAGPSSKMAIELSRWGRPDDKNAQYVLTPYSVPANTVRFQLPSGTVSHWMDWQPDRVSFRTLRGASPRKTSPLTIAEHRFTSGVHAPGNEGISLNLYALDTSRNPLTHPFEVIIEKFEFLP